MTRLRHTTVILFCLTALLGLSACNTSSTGLKSKDDDKASQTAAEATAPAEETAEAAKTETATVINRPGKVSNKGGYIKILVNNEPITNFDIQRRLAFMKLRRAGGGTKAAENELIEQSLKLAEARRTNTLAGDDGVNTAFAGFAKRNGASSAQLTQELGRLGIGAKHFKEFIRTQSSWQRTVNGKFQSDTQRVSQVDAITQIRKSGEAKPELAEYHIQQVIFVIPESKRSSTISNRRLQAKAFRQRFSSCAETLQTAKTLRDVSVLDRRRIMAPELPNAWKDEIAGLSPGQTTTVKDTNRGVEFIAICEMVMVNDDRAAQIATQSKEFESFNEKGSKLSQEYLAELRSRATIVYR